MPRKVCIDFQGLLHFIYCFYDLIWGYCVILSYATDKLSHFYALAPMLQYV